MVWAGGDRMSGSKKMGAKYPLRDLTLRTLAFTSDISRLPAGARPLPGRIRGFLRGHLHLGTFGVLGRFALTMSAAGIVALVVTGRFPPLRNTAASGPHGVVAGRTSSTTEWPQGPAPRLAILQAVLSGADEDLPLGMSVLGASDSAALVITGLPPGSVLSSGRRVGADGWRISAADLDNSVIHLPRAFVGTVDLSVELRLPDGTVAEHRSLRLERTPETSVGQTQSAPPLDLLRIEGATRVQQRLSELGFLSGPADGVWGPRSRSALGRFRIANQLASDDTWDERTQRELFATSAAPASAASQPTGPITETTIAPPPGAARNPLNRSDALWIQKRLHDLGYYFGNDDAIWAAESRSALRDFKGMNGLPENDTWDKETEQRLSDQNTHASSIFIGGWGLDLHQCQEVQNDGAPITISSHRAETVGGACDFRSVKRDAANSWRIQALCSADGTSWKANISLKLSGSKLSWSSQRGTATYVRCPRK
jgi:peptidoglycan hydrolase-like protein with peptidoglycan-binding domain